MQKNLLPPKHYLDSQPISNEIASVVSNSRKNIENILDGKDKRMFVIVGPCSIHDEVSCLDYAKRLKSYDKKLFLWPAKSNGVKRVQYSTTCDATTQRQPIVVSDEELKRINMSEDLGSGRKSYKNVMKYGSDPNSQYNYICPQYWDAKEKLSLDPNSDKWDRNKIFKKEKRSSRGFTT